MYAATPRGHRATRLIDGLATACANDDRRTFRRKFFGDGPAEALAPCSDDRNPVTKAQIHGYFRR